MTCAPATFSALSRHWSAAADHLAMVEEISYDGTPVWKQRRWAAQNGWLVREFAMTWDTARFLIDRGVPFMLITVEPGASHAQAVIGYDARRGTLLIRDPSHRHAREALAAALLESHRSTGPHAMLSLPPGETARLEGVELRDAEWYDMLYDLHLAIDEHARQRAEAILDGMLHRDPRHRLTREARLQLATYDADPIASLAAIEEALQQFPDDVNLLLSKLNYQRDLAPREERLALLHELCERPVAEPLLWRMHAEELCADARQHAAAVYWLRRALRRRPLDGTACGLLADIRWRQGDFEQAFSLYRLATCLNDKDDTLASSYFNACRHLHQVERAMRLLNHRFEQFAARSSRPAMALLWAHEQLDQIDDALRRLDEALNQRGDDGDLLLFAADVYGRYGRYEQAQGFLARARGASRDVAWQRTAANLAAYQGRLADSLACWRAVLRNEPLSLDAHAAVARLLAATQDRPAAVTHLRDAARRFEHHVGIQRLCIEWLRGGPKDDWERAVRRMLEVHRVDAWAQRELALALAAQERFDEAVAANDLANTQEPRNTYCFGIRGDLLVRMGRYDEAKAAFREAISLSVDNQQAQAGLLAACHTRNERRVELEFISSELVSRTTFGDGLISFREHARNVLDGESLLTMLREAQRARPDLWHTWSALVAQLSDMDRLDEAQALAQQATLRFPLLPAAWSGLAAVEQRRGDEPAQLAALEKALCINPGWSVTVLQLVDLHERRGEMALARAALERALARGPDDHVLQSRLAHVLWKSDDRAAAFEAIQRALRLEPAVDWAWTALATWSSEAGRSGVALGLAQELTAERPGDARSWYALALVRDPALGLAER
ncbi:MAG TPA: tetratricopeptide repeat protein, partial [Pirellulales bacterium]|nr:tetratricopeptide repeat protein [Pirellulales bacterium]